MAMFSTSEVKQWLDEARRLGLEDVTALRGIRFLESLLAAFAPRETALLPNYPNPFNPETWIPYRLAADSEVDISIYDGRGNLGAAVGSRASNGGALYRQGTRGILGWTGTNTPKRWRAAYTSINSAPRIIRTCAGW